MVMPPADNMSADFELLSSVVMERTSKTCKGLRLTIKEEAGSAGRWAQALSARSLAAASIASAGLKYICLHNYTCSCSYSWTRLGQAC